MTARAARDFLAELAVMLAGAENVKDSVDNRDIQIKPEAAPSAKSIAAFVVEGPEIVDATTTRDDWFLERFLANSSTPGRDVLSSVLRGFVPASAKPLLFAGAGPRLYVGVVAFGKPVEKILDYKFTTTESLLGPGWHLQPLFSAVGAEPLDDYLTELGIDASIRRGGRILAGSLRVAEERARA